jgi:hypothetical protein
MAAAYWISVFACGGVVRVVPAAIHLYDGEGCGLRVGKKKWFMNIVRSSWLGNSSEAHNREPVLVSRKGTYANRMYSHRRIAGRIFRRGSTAPSRASPTPPGAAPKERLRGVCLCHPRGGEVRRRRDSLNVCVQHRGERVADRADYRVVRLGIPVELV